MKRTEMLSKLLDRLDKIKGCDPSTGEPLYPHDDYIVYSMLDEVEKLGMLPPFSSKVAVKSNQIDAAGYEWEEE